MMVLKRFATGSNFVRMATAFSVLALAACGGGGGNGGRVNSTAKPTLTYLEVLDSVEGRFERAESNYPAPSGSPIENGAIVRTVNMPTTGTANYNGDLGIMIGDGVSVNHNGDIGNNFPQVAAQGTLRADFSTKTLAGKITDFVAAPGHRSTGGEVTYNGNISGNRTQGSWSGHVNFDGENHTFNNVKEVNGYFGGDSAAVLEMDGDGFTTTGKEVEIDGFFEKNGKLGK